MKYSEDYNGENSNILNGRINPTNIILTTIYFLHERLQLFWTIQISNPSFFYHKFSTGQSFGERKNFIPFQAYNLSFG